MMLKSKSTQPKRSAWTLLRAGLAGLAVMAGAAAMTAGCLDRPVAPAEPHTSNVYVDEIRQTAVDKIDLLFMIDNSISMADKQAILAEAVPLLVQRLVTPICVRACTKADNCNDQQARDGIPVGGNSDATGKCAMGGPEFTPIKDIHVGVVTSSLGSHGAAGAKDVCITMEDDDHARLLGSIRQGLTTYQNLGFLKWDTTRPAKYNPPGTSDPMGFADSFKNMVTAAGEHGCGYEASLEAWYRFLIDPEPPAQVTVDMASSQAVVSGVDQTVLSQRAAFLRPDSLVAIVMLSDENDCSIQDGGYGWLIAHAASMYRSTSQCAANPNDKCCQSCGESTPNAGCGAIASDPECAKGKYLDQASDSLNLRCWHQKQRFGFDLLYPTARYSAALRPNQVFQRSTGKYVENPLYKAAAGAAPRDKGLVFLAGIIGVPWQDIADDASLKDPGSLRYLTEAELEAKGRWNVILGSSNVGTNDAPVAPTDPLMIEQPTERQGVNPITMDAIAPSTSMNPQANKINGHEQANMDNTDLQYACIFPLAKPIVCDEARNTNGQGCDCFTDDLGYNRPLCQPPGGGAPTTTQTYAKAYPGLRHLQVLKEFKDNSVVASICPKLSATADVAKADYGYNPAVKAIIDRLKEALKGKCLPRPLLPEETGQVPCAVIEATPKGAQGCSCDAGQNRASVDNRPDLRDAVLTKLSDEHVCDKRAGTCDNYCTCELLQLTGKDLTDCQNNDAAPDVPGYCYINAAPHETAVGNPNLVKDCTADSKRLLRFVGGTPTKGAIALVACLGAGLGQ